MEFQEQHRALQAERDGLRGALQLLKSQHSCAVKDAQQQTQRMVVSQETERGTCKFELVCGLHVSCGPLLVWQQKEEETTKLRDSLEQQKQEAKRREAKLLAGASEQVETTCCAMATVTHNTAAGDLLTFLLR